MFVLWCKGIDVVGAVGAVFGFTAMTGTLIRDSLAVPFDSVE